MAGSQLPDDKTRVIRSASLKGIAMATSALPWTTVWITGASTGIGREVALQLARAGVNVAASDRVIDKLADLAASQPRITAYPLDVTDGEAVTKTAAAIKAAMGPIDLAVLCAGVAHPMGAANYDVNLAVHSVNVNYNGILRALGALMPDMIKRGSGHLALIASMTGHRGMPDSAAYAPTKAAIINLTETLKLDLARYGITISVINPGFVDTPITQQLDYPLPHIMTPADAAERIIDGLRQRKYEIAFPWQMNWPTKILRMMPNSLYFWCSRKIEEAGKTNR